uniref:Uncharacterized protein n=1 Tax=Aeromonas hydrophila TaxID=644 RepID=Q5YL15_AERHY|nr:unknown [Aeromonas hydrophila]
MNKAPQYFTTTAIKNNPRNFPMPERNKTSFLKHLYKNFVKVSTLATEVTPPINFAINYFNPVTINSIWSTVVTRLFFIVYLDYSYFIFIFPILNISSNPTCSGGPHNSHFNFTICTNKAPIVYRRHLQHG